MGTSCMNNFTCKYATRTVILDLRTAKKLLFWSFLVSNLMCGQSILWGWGNTRPYYDSPRRLTYVNQGLGLLASSTPDQISIRSYSYPWWIRSNYTCYSLIHPFVPVFGSRCFFWEAKIKFINNRELCCIVRVVSVLYDPRKQHEYEFYPVTSTTTASSKIQTQVLVPAPVTVPAFQVSVPPSSGDQENYETPIIPESASENRASTEQTIGIEQSKMSTSTTPMPVKILNSTLPVPSVPVVVKFTESQNTEEVPTDPEDVGTIRNPNEAEVMIQNVIDKLAQAENNQTANTIGTGTGAGNTITDSNFTDNSTTKKTSLLADTVIPLPNITEAPTLTAQNPPGPGLIPIENRNTNDNNLFPNLNVTTDATVLTSTTTEQNNKILTSSTFDSNGGFVNSFPDSTAIGNETIRAPATATNRPEKVNVTTGGSSSDNALEKKFTTISVFAYDNFREPSQSFQVFDKCTTLPGDWQRRISSVNTAGTCVEVCQYRNCDGRCFRLAPGTLGHNRLRDVDFDKRISSLKACKSK